jgi:hypothetical protein
MKHSYSFQLFADYFQFYLQDETAEGDLGHSWTDEAVERLLVLASGTIGVGTARNMTVPVVVEVWDQAPSDEKEPWDQINECSIEIPSGRIVVAGCSDYFPEAARIPVARGAYRARICYGKLDSLRGNGLEGDDHYKVILWQAPLAPLHVIKQRKINRAPRTAAAPALSLGPLGKGATKTARGAKAGGFAPRRAMQAEPPAVGRQSKEKNR